MSYAQDPDAPVITHVSVDHIFNKLKLIGSILPQTLVGYVIYFEDISGLWIPLIQLWELQILII